MTLLHSMGSQWKKSKRLFVRPFMNTSINVKSLEKTPEKPFSMVGMKPWEFLTFFAASLFARMNGEIIKRD